MGTRSIWGVKVTAAVAFEHWPLNSWHFDDTHRPSQLAAPNCTAMIKCLEPADDGSILFLSSGAAQHICPYDRSDMAKETKPSRDPRGRAIRT